MRKLKQTKMAFYISEIVAWVIFFAVFLFVLYWGSYFAVQYIEWRGVTEAEWGERVSQS